MLMKMRQWMKGGEKGQGMTEYIIIVCLVGIACLGAVGAFGDQMFKTWVKMEEAIGGSGGAKKIELIKVPADQGSTTTAPVTAG